jgi:hypothetical protein
MGFSETMIFYHLIGVGVAAAVFLSETGQGPVRHGFRVATAVVFWPLYLPILLAGRRPSSKPEVARRSGDHDAMSQAISQVESELETALASLDGWAEDVLAHETHRLGELGRAWRAQAERVREIDRLLNGGDRAGLDASPAPLDPQAGDRCRRSEQTRRANLARLHQIRGRAYEDLMGTLAWVRELVSMIHLAKFTGAPASRAGELVAQIAAAVEGISAVTWRDEIPATDTDIDSSGTTPCPAHPQEERIPCDFSAASATSSPRT